jgi:hypothetical protein
VHKVSLLTCPSRALLVARLFLTSPRRKRRPALRRSVSRWICSASSRVGARSNTLMPLPLLLLPLLLLPLHRRARAGMTKAAVFPDPCMCAQQDIWMAQTQHNTTQHGYRVSPAADVQMYSRGAPTAAAAAATAGGDTYRGRRSQQVSPPRQHGNSLHLDRSGFFPVAGLDVAQHHCQSLRGQSGLVELHYRSRNLGALHLDL